MANLLIGYGETLTRRIKFRGGGGEKKHPYKIDNRRERLAPQIESLLDGMRALPPEAKPQGEATALITVHPAYEAKSYFPDDVFRKSGLRAVGSRPIRVTPELDIRPSAPEGPQLSADIYVSGREEQFTALGKLLLDSKTPAVIQTEFVKIEHIALLGPGERAIDLEGSEAELDLEVVLHAIGRTPELLAHFAAYVERIGGRVDVTRRFDVPGLLFLPVRADRVRLTDLCLYTAMRAVRRMPKLRVCRPHVRENVSSEAPIELPGEAALREDVTVAVFDGGLGISDFNLWCSEVQHAETNETTAEFLTHGTEVTSTLLFGAVDRAKPILPRPAFRIEHHRVIGPRDHDLDLYDCMHRVDDALHGHAYEFANFSLGPRLAIEDSQPHAWTCMLDKHLAGGSMLATVAVGNDGHIVPVELARVQPPSDAVNALAVGAADSVDFLWGRAAYSCRGPGRSPGLVKPDGLAFGGREGNPLVIYSPYERGLTGVCGTSYAAPLALRLAATARAISETPLSATALRALLVHRAEPGTHAVDEVGWGRFPGSVEELLTCLDNEAVVMYQGVLHPGSPVRAKIPVPPVEIGTRITIKATFCFACGVDPADPVNYTRRGLTIVFRPEGPESSAPFFSTSSHPSEQELRRDAAKWETVLCRTQVFESEKLAGPTFDIQLGTRQRGLPTSKKVTPTPYVLIVTISSDRRAPIYQQVLTQNQTLQPIKLRQQVVLRT